MQVANEWLEGAAKIILNEIFHKPHLFDDVSLACAPPTTRAFSEKQQVIGQTCEGEGGRMFVTISPTRFHPDFYIEVLGTLIHEIIHVDIGVEQEHNGLFKEGMREVGLEGPAKTTLVSEGLKDRLNGMRERIGPIPDVQLLGTKKKKPEATRLIKLVCKCKEPRILRVSNKVASGGGILCEVCTKLFEEPEETTTTEELKS